MFRRSLPWAALAALLPALLPALAFAQGADPSAPTPKGTDAEITSDTTAQFYEMRSPTGQTVLARRRLVTTLGVAVYDLMDKPQNPLGPTLTFRARMRYDADYGASSAEVNPLDYDRYVPGYSRGPVDLMYGYIEGRRFLDGWLGFKLGRQYVVDALGWWSFDGGSAKITTPYYVAAEVFGGLEQRGGMPLSLPRFERDGVWRGDRSEIQDRSMWPSYQPSDIAPAFGAALETAGFTWLHGRLTYRRVYNTGGSSVSPFGSGLYQPAVYDGTRISQERVGYAFNGTLPNVGGLKAGIAYDMYVARVSNLYASLDWFTTERVTLSADYDYYVPTFDGDSIWNFFMAMPMNDLGLRGSWDASDHLSLSGGLRGRLFSVQTEDEANTSTSAPTSPNGLSTANYYPSSGVQPMGGGNLAARYRIGEGAIGARGVVDVADNGQRMGMDVYGERTLETRYVLSGRAGVWQWDDQLRDGRDAVSVGYVAGAGYKLLPRSLVYADFQHDINRLVGNRFRAMVWLTIALSTRGER